MYHAVSPEHDAFGTHTVSPAAFSRQIAWLCAHYPLARLSELPALLRTSPCGTRHVVVTFDDGFQSFLEHAYPVLERWRVPVTQFVPTAFLGRFNVISAGDLVLLHREGLVDVGSHTVDHLNMRSLSLSEARRQAVESRRQLEALLDVPVRSFAYPFGQWQHFSASTSRVLAEAGYDIAVTSCWGTRNRPSDIMRLRRISLDEHDTDETMQAKIEGRCDWRAWKERAGYALWSLGRPFRTTHQMMAARRSKASVPLMANSKSVE
jgi:peptidoglycan/xylan/chitin deacetylase (PgdA/CDA1 family)